MTNARVDEIRRSMNATFKKEVLSTASDPRFIVKYIPTGIVPIDIALGGGIPKNRYTTLIGDFSTLKSYIALCAIRECQKMGGVAALMDTEHSFDPEWAEDIGVNTGDLLLPPEIPTGERAVDVMEGLIRQKVDLIVWDSIAASLPQAEQQRGMEDEKMQMARLATLMSRAMRKLTAANSETAVILINQLRVNVGVMFGNPEQPTGGKAAPYYSSLQLQIQRTSKDTTDVQVFDGKSNVKSRVLVAQQYKATLTKSKLSKPHGETFFTWSMKDSAIDEVRFIFAQSVEHGFVKQIGKSSWSIVGTQTRVNGRDKFIQYLKDNPNEYDALRLMVLAANGVVPVQNSPGLNQRASSKVAPRKKLKRSDVARGSTRTVVPVPSKTMRLRKKT